MEFEKVIPRDSVRSFSQHNFISVDTKRKVSPAIDSAAASEALYNKYRGSPLHKPLPDDENDDEDDPAWQHWEPIKRDKNAASASATFHSKPILCCAFNASGNILYTGSEDETIKVWDAETSLLIATFAGHQGYVTDILYVESLRRLFSCSNGGEVIVWQYAQTQRSLKYLQILEPAPLDAEDPVVQTPEAAYMLAWYSRLNYLIVGFKDSIRLYHSVDDASNNNESHWEPILSAEESREKEERARMRARASMKAARAAEKAAALLTAAKREPIVAPQADPVLIPKPRQAVRNDHPSMKRTFHVVYCDGYIVSGRDNGMLCVWEYDLHERKLVRQCEQIAHDMGVTALIHEPTNNWVISGSFDRSVRIWSYLPSRAATDYSEGRFHLLHSFDAHTHTITGLTYVPPTHTLWVATNSNTPAIYDLATLSDVTASLDTGLRAADSTFLLTRLYFFPSVTKVIGLCNQRQLVVWAFRRGAAITTLSEHTDVVDCVCISTKDPLLIFSGGGDGRVLQWERKENNQYTYRMEELWVRKPPVMPALAYSTPGREEVASARDERPRPVYERLANTAYYRARQARSMWRVMQDQREARQRQIARRERSVYEQADDSLPRLGSRESTTRRMSTVDSGRSGALAAAGPLTFITQQPDDGSADGSQEGNAGAEHQDLDIDALFAATNPLSRSTSMRGADGKLRGPEHRTLLGVNCCVYWDKLDLLLVGCSNSKIYVFAYEQRAAKRGRGVGAGAGDAEELPPLVEEATRGTERMRTRVSGMAKLTTLPEGPARGEGHTDEVTAMIVVPRPARPDAPDLPEQVLISVSRDRSLRVWNLITFQSVPENKKSWVQQERDADVAARKPVLCVAHCPRHDLLAYGSEDGQFAIRTFGEADFKGFPGTDLIGDFMAHKGPLHCVAWNDSWDKWVTGGADGYVSMWDARSAGPVRIKTVAAMPSVPASLGTPAPPAPPPVPGPKRRPLAFGGTGIETGAVPASAPAIAAPATTLRATGGKAEDGVLEVGSAVLSMCVHTGDTTQCESSTIEAAVQATKGLIVVGTKDKNICVYDPTRAEALQVLTGHADSVRCLVYLPQRHQYVSASYDNTVKIWNAYTRPPVKPPVEIVQQPPKAATLYVPAPYARREVDPSNRMVIESHLRGVTDSDGGREYAPRQLQDTAFVKEMLGIASDLEHRESKQSAHASGRRPSAPRGVLHRTGGATAALKRLRKSKG